MHYPGLLEWRRLTLESYESGNSLKYKPKVPIVSNTHIVLERRVGASGGRRIGCAVCRRDRVLSLSISLYRKWIHEFHLLATVRNISGHFLMGVEREMGVNHSKCEL